MGRDREGSGSGGGGSADVRNRIARVHEWVFLTGNRSLVAGGLLVPLFAVLATIEYRFASGAAQMVPLFYMASAIIGGNFTLITIVISINQLVISRQLSAPGELRELVADTVAYREASTELVEKDVPPPTPSSFLWFLLRGVRESIYELEHHQSDVDDDAMAALDEVVAPLADEVERSIQQLESEDTNTFEALVVTLNTNYSDDIHGIRHLEASYRRYLTPDVKDCLDTLVTGLEYVDVARQYLKTVYIQTELARLSRNLLYVGVPVILSGLVLMEVFVSTRRSILSPTQLSMLTPVFVTAAAAPLSLLFAYVLRLSVVSERTAAVTPFTTPTQEETPVEAITEGADD